MSDVSITGVVQAEYEYNALGQQVVRRLTVGGQTIHSVHDGDGNRIAEYEFDPVNLTSTLLREYVWMNGQAVGVIEGGMLYLVRSDRIGRPVFATNTLGVKGWEAAYLPFGGIHTSTGSPSNLRFPGQWFQSEGGLHQNWMRDYDPTTGRYVQGDPLGLVDGASVYGYVRQNPGRYIDPTGLEGEGKGDDTGFGDPGVKERLKQRLRDPDISQREKSRIKKRLKEIDRADRKIKSESDKKSKKTKKRSPRFGPPIIVPKGIFDPCNFIPHCIKADVSPDGDPIKEIGSCEGA